jgi:hypothetical protein
MLPFPQAVNAGPLVMYRHLRAIAARHEVTLATFAGADPSEWDAIDQLRRSGIHVKAVWRLEPSRLFRAWKGSATLPHREEWGRTVQLPQTDPDVSHIKASTVK